MNNIVSTKNEQIEYLRAAAICAVVLVHTVNSGLIYSGENPNPLVYSFFNGVRDWAYWGVPVFLMITGMLLLNPEKDITISKIYRKYIFRMICVLAIFGTGFSLMELLLKEHTLNISMVRVAILKVISGDTWAHMWYVYALIGIYLLLPLYRAVTARVSNQELQYILLIFCIFQMVLPVFESLFNFSLGFYLLITRYHLIYLLLGECKRRDMYRLSKKQSLFIGIVCSMTIILLSSVLCLKSVKINALFGAGSLLIMILSYVILSFIQQVKITDSLIKRVSLELADKSFAIYLVHMVLINTVYQVLKIQIMNSWLATVIVPLIVLCNIIISYLMACILKKVPLLKDIL